MWRVVSMMEMNISSSFTRLLIAIPTATCSLEDKSAVAAMVDAKSNTSNVTVFSFIFCRFRLDVICLLSLFHDQIAITSIPFFGCFVALSKLILPLNTPFTRA